MISFSVSLNRIDQVNRFEFIGELKVVFEKTKKSRGEIDLLRSSIDQQEDYHQLEDFEL